MRSVQGPGAGGRVVVRRFYELAQPGRVVLAGRGGGAAGGIAADDVRRREGVSCTLLVVILVLPDFPLTQLRTQPRACVTFSTPEAQRGSFSGACCPPATRLDLPSKANEAKQVQIHRIPPTHPHSPPDRKSVV